jgi:hypothetical protein
LPLAASNACHKDEMPASYADRTMGGAGLEPAATCV